MAKRNRSIPKGATIINTYAAVESLIGAFARGHISLLVIIGAPGVSKSQSVKKAVGNTTALVIKGRSTPMDFYCKVFEYQDCPIIIDDADDLMSNKLSKQFIKILTETDQYKRLDYGTTSKLLSERGVPAYYSTKSPVCIITNSWNSLDPVCQAIESRAEFDYFQPSWEEVYRQVATWFYDQQIFDYVGSKLPLLRKPDMRLFVKAYNRKKAGVADLDWRDVIDDYVDDQKGLLCRKLLDDKRLRTTVAKVKAWEAKGYSRPTWFRKVKELEQYRCSVPMKIKLKHTEPPQEERPHDGYAPDLGDEGEDD